MDGYCERLGPGIWAEPVNAVTNVAFLLAAAVMARRAGGDGLARALAGVLGAIGLGSLLFHTLATPWAAAADVLPILAYVLLYVYAAHRRFWGQGRGPSLLFAAASVPWIAALTPVLAQVPGFGASAVYWPIPLLILVHAALLRRRAPATARGLAAGAGVLVLSLVARSLDGPLCAAVPVGTHFLWHLLNALMLGWMIEVLLRHGRAGAAGEGRLAARAGRR